MYPLFASGNQSIGASASVLPMNISSPTRDQTLAPCFGRWILNHWTTREVPFSFFNTPHHIFPGHGISSHTVTVLLYCIYLYHLALGIITLKKASGGDGIPAELFLILKDNVVKVLHSICQQIWKTQQWPQDWKRSVFIPIQKESNAKKCSNYCTIVLISHASKIMHKILQARLQQYMNREISDVQTIFIKGRRTRDQLASICWIVNKTMELKKKKKIYF